MTGRLAWFHCFSGIAGDMALGALVDAGADLDEITNICHHLPVGGWTLEAEPVLRCGIAATKVHVHTKETTVVRTAAHITGLIEEARLPDRVRDRALATFDGLAEAEGRLHRRPPSQVHFHEVGALDAIIDIVGTCAALHVLDVEAVHASSVATGTGMHRAAHGLLPSPAPAVIELLRGAPSHGIDVPFETTTPTGAALLAAIVVGWGGLPPMVVRASGFGAGTRELDDRPNVTQVVLGDPVEGTRTGQPVVLLETNVDDATGEVVADAVGALLDAGAHDAWVTNILMKKGRPAHQVSALVDPSLVQQVMDAMTAATGSLGVRGTTLDRWPQARLLDEVEVAGHAVRVKVSAGRVKIEHDDASRAAQRAGLPVREVISLAEEAWRRRGEVPEASGPIDEPPPEAG